MTQRYDAGRTPDHAQDVLNRWCVLAEQRLDFLIELYESGRWRRYHSENAFMENLREAKTVVEVWRMLARREAMPDNRAVDWSWLNRPSDSSAIQGDTVPVGAAVPRAALAIAGSQEDSMLRANNDVPAGKAA
ncbi:TIGR03809 family protein [Nitrobacter vulgaris]|uniref:TIGR03809 family protein n=1 Tax=Nitrobacter vulgaris TaxID=29421 RepID=A0A1V4HY66_NITVU|nr:TIGR03809 family protein [Nitrobacter vulgaris]